jgi:hypothetical protein
MVIGCMVTSAQMAAITEQMAPAEIKEQHAQHAKKARIRGFMGSYGVLLFSRPSAYIYLCISSHLG